MPDPQMRAADTDRDAVAHRLGEHMTAGRLTVAEYEDRVARAYTAKTYGELADLTNDLPSSRPATRPAPQPAATGPCGAAPWGGAWSAGPWRRAVWGSWLSTAVIVTTIWLITCLSAGAFLYFWPIWVIGPWGAVLLAQTLSGGGGRSHRRHRPHNRV
jgi:hypothetical protein